MGDSHPHVRMLKTLSNGLGVITVKTRGFVAFLAWLTLGIVLSAQAEEAGLKTLEDSDAAAASEAADRADLLMITNEELAPAWSKFANWKTATSRPTVVVTIEDIEEQFEGCLLYTSPSPRDLSTSRMPSSA